MPTLLLCSGVDEVVTYRRPLSGCQCVFCVVFCQLDAVERVVFCLFLPVDVQCYAVSMCNYFPLSANTSDAVGLFAADTLPGITSDVDRNKGVCVCVCVLNLICSPGYDCKIFN